MRDEIVYLIWDITCEGEVICVSDNDHDILRFLLAHKDIYPWKEGVEQDAHKLWRDILNAKVDIQAMGEYFEGIEVVMHHLNYDYLDEQERLINTVADEKGVDEFLMTEDKDV